MSREFTIVRYALPRPDGKTTQVLKIDVAPTFVERIIPPAGEDHAFDVQHYRRSVEIYVSPTGRSVRVWVDGNEVER